MVLLHTGNRLSAGHCASGECLYMTKHPFLVTSCVTLHMLVPCTSYVNTHNGPTANMQRFAMCAQTRVQLSGHDNVNETVQCCNANVPVLLIGAYCASTCKFNV